MTSWGTLLAGVAASVGLIYSARSTTFTGLAFEAQTKQQQKQAKEAAARQASHLNSYIPGDSSRPRGKIVVENTSDLPAYSVSFAVRSYSGVVFDLIVGVVSPCTRTTVDLHDRTLGSEDFEKGFDENAGVVVQFWDSKGRAWWRDTGSQELEGTDFNPPSLKPVPDSVRRSLGGIANVWPGKNPRWEEPSQDGGIYVQSDEIETTKAANCG